MQVIKIGIASREELRDRTLAIAAGKLKPSPDDPKVFVSSIEEITQAIIIRAAAGR